VELRDIDEAAVTEVLRLAPFGHGNEAPTFAARNVEVASMSVFAEKHLRVVLRQNGRSLTMKAWNFAERAGELAVGARLDVAFSLEEDAYSAARGYPPWCATLCEVRAAEQGQSATTQ
jgi:single-stranded-DNA-specific exonuclease